MQECRDDNPRMSLHIPSDVYDGVGSRGVGGGGSGAVPCRIVNFGNAAKLSISVPATIKPSQFCMHVNGNAVLYWNICLGKSNHCILCMIM